MTKQMPLPSSENVKNGCLVRHERWVRASDGM